MENNIANRDDAYIEQKLKTTKQNEYILRF